MIKKIYILLLLLFLGCQNRHNPFSENTFGVCSEFGSNWCSNLDILENVGRVRDLHFDSNRLFVATEDRGIYIYDILSEEGENSYLLKNGQFLDQVYESEEWGVGKDLRSIYYADEYDMLFALDYNNNTYLGYVDILISSSTSLVQNSCGPDANARKFFINTNSDNPEIYILYKCFEGSSQCINNPYQNVATTVLQSLGSSLYDDFEFFGDFSTSSSCDASPQIPDLSVDVNDMFFNDNHFFIANPSSGVNSFGVYDMNGNLLDEYITDSPVRSIYALSLDGSANNIILAGTENGCYITLLDDGGISDISESKLIIAEGLTIYDIFYENNRLILSSGPRGMLVYDWDNMLSEPIEYLRIFSTNSEYSSVTRFYNGMYFVGTEYGLQIYNLD
ncbi:MAG: hypothetical protein CMG66_03355 [Candidatus Marinimicrobia bacterium]|nr:hypothetical protein [Candidatus Neomarinimicrobiota bacterium]|tara:strand:- start:13177 stop:14349 length:1173 start_codon:yes stop_codon:yes gene_type:complete